MPANRAEDIMTWARVFSFGSVLVAVLSATFTANAMDSEDPIGLDSGWWFGTDTGSDWGGSGLFGFGGGSGGKGWSPKDPKPCEACKVDCGPNGEMWEPGTGCHPNSRCFQDLDNWLTANELVSAVLDCWDAKGDATTVTEGTRVIGMTCTIGGVVSEQSFPTTKACRTSAFGPIPIP